jgi:LPXTG-motif cell wall-anchored protein
VAGGSGTTASSGAATSLPFTGFEVGAASAIGIAALSAGTIFIVASRRRRSPGDSAAV